MGPENQFTCKIQRFLIKVEIKGLSCVGASCHPHTYKVKAEGFFLPRKRVQLLGEFGDFSERDILWELSDLEINLVEGNRLNCVISF